MLKMISAILVATVVLVSQANAQKFYEGILNATNDEMSFPNIEPLRPGSGHGDPVFTLDQINLRVNPYAVLMDSNL